MKRKIVVILSLFLLCFAMSILAEDLVWENIGEEISGVNVVLVDRLNPQYIYLGAERGIFRSQDGGDTWRSDNRLHKNINFLWQDAKGIVYAATKEGLFITMDQGKTWKRIFRGRNSEENNCQRLTVLKEGRIYLGTNAGLFISGDEGRTWHKESGRLGNMAISSIAKDPANNIIYVVAANKVFKMKNGLSSYSEIFNLGQGSINNGDEDNKEQDLEKPAVSFKIRYIAVDPNLSNRLYLATVFGVYMSQDEGLTWDLMSDFGLLTRDIKFILLSQASCIYAVTESGIFVYKNERWQELSLRLVSEDIRFLAIDNQDNLYAACDKGVFKALQQDLSRDEQEICANFKAGPGIRELHQAAIKYAQVIDPVRIENLRKQARLKAILPELNLDYDKTITSYSNTATTRFVVGPLEWGASLKWNLSDLIWSEQQRLIDSQVRLMIELRNDILDEVNKIYFERQKVKIELAHLSHQDPKKIWEKKLKLEELTASLDALTGGYFSQHLKD